VPEVGVPYRSEPARVGRVGGLLDTTAGLGGDGGAIETYPCARRLIVRRGLVGVLGCECFDFDALSFGEATGVDRGRVDVWGSFD
jgi:hypothetical protein